jgi:DNA-binding transcriptional ArsR family regulator
MNKIYGIPSRAAHVSSLDDDGLDAVFMALADPTRRAILARLASGEATVNELVEPFNMSQPAISKHLKVLERAGLVSGGRDAQRRPRRLEAKPMAVANEWLESYRQFWEARYARLDDVLANLVAAEKRPRRIRNERTALPPSPPGRGAGGEGSPGKPNTPPPKSQRPKKEKTHER